MSAPAVEREPPMLLRAHEVCAMVGICRATLFKWCDESPDFPQRIQLGPRAVRWRRDELLAWLDSRPAVPRRRRRRTTYEQWSAA